MNSPSPVSEPDGGLFMLFEFKLSICNQATLTRSDHAPGHGQVWSEKTSTLVAWTNEMQAQDSLSSKSCTQEC